MTLLTVEHITKRFGGLVAVDDVSFELAQGEVLGLIGPNGAGKTTLFNVISGTYLPDNGRVLYYGTQPNYGTSLVGAAPYEICRFGVGRTFQIVKPFARLNVLDNVKVGAFLHVGDTAGAEERAWEVIEFVGLAADAGKSASSLTTAGRKRLELARALATDPKLLLLDEVMAGLTPTESAAIVELVRRVRGERGVTLLVIEHVMKAVMSLSDRVAVLHHGQLIAIDKPAVIARDPKVIEAYLGKEFELA